MRLSIKMCFMYAFQKWHIPSRVEGIVAQRVDEVVLQKPKKQTTSTMPRTITSTLYNPIRVPLDELSVKIIEDLRPQLLDLTPRPQILQLWPEDTATIKYTDSRFGRVPVGSVLSYQQPLKQSNDDDDILVTSEVPSLPLPVLPMANFTMDDNELNYVSSLEVSREVSEQYRQDTRLQSKSPLWHALRKGRLTASNFKRVTSRRGDFEKLAKELLKSKNIQTAAMKYGSIHEPVAAQAYATHYGHNIYLTGIVINPSCPHLACSPDRIVYDPDLGEFGLLEIKCPDKDSYLECSYLQQSDDNCTLKKSNQYYEQVIGQLGITGFSWCDFYVQCRNDCHCERILYDDRYFAAMKVKLDFFFYTYLVPEIVKIGALSEL